MFAFDDKIAVKMHMLCHVTGKKQKGNRFLKIQNTRFVSGSPLSTVKHKMGAFVLYTLFLPCK